MNQAPRGRKPPLPVIPRYRALEFRVLEVLWDGGPASVRSVQEAFAEADRPSYETVRSVMYRLQQKKAVRRVRRVSKTQIFEACIARQAVQDEIIDDFANLFSGDIRPVLERLARAGRLTRADLRDAERLMDDDQAA
jgi:predicted transcriptional regulator